MRKLTGKYYFKPTLFGVALVVEHHKKDTMPDGEIIDLEETKWSRATMADVVKLGLNYNEKK